MDSLTDGRRKLYHNPKQTGPRREKDLLFLAMGYEEAEKRKEWQRTEFDASPCKASR